MKYLPLFLVLALMASSCTPNPTTVSEKLESLFNDEVELPSGRAPGVAVMVIRNDSVIFSKFQGLADVHSKEPITGKTLFNLGSISKTFVSNAILMLRDEGKLSLEDSVIKYFPEFKNKDIASKVKIKHLLTHTSGLPDNRKAYEDDRREFFLTADDAQNWQPVTQADALVFEPGTQYEYSNPAYNALALIIEKVTGQNWRRFVEERIFKPAGMTASTITDGPHPERGVSHGYDRDESGEGIQDGTTDFPEWLELDFGEEPTFCAAGNGGVWSSVEELVKYQKALETAAFSTSATIAESQEIKTFPGWKGSEPPFIGWSWFIEKAPNGQKVVGHTGTQGGFYCDYISIPEKKILYVMLANYPIERDHLHPHVIRILSEQEL
ncbi:MAG TPA: serine hydrolase domain-containing protein [Cyclobacteriaceae bacterium]|nr:serine hydrolase domain-containing protein [Cyclobacteriaceae bacterium]